MLLATFARARPTLRLDVRADQSAYLRRDLERGELDLALLKRDAGEKGGIAVMAGTHPLGHQQDPPGGRELRFGPADRLSRRLPLPGARHPRHRKRRPRLAHGLYQFDLAGIQAAVAAGLGLSILSEIAIQADHRVLTAKDGFAPIDKTEVALVAAPEASPATLRLADRLAEFCHTVQAKAA